MPLGSSIDIYPANTQHIPRHIANTQSILLGGPCTGKSEICQSLDDITYINTAEGLESVDTDQPIILDNAYQILSDPELDTSEYITTPENHAAGVCYVFRPYELEWIVSHSSGINFDFDSIQVLSLVYTDSEAISELHLVDESLPESKIMSFVDDLEYEFSFADAPIDDYHSYLPYCPVRASNAAVEDVIAGNSVTAKISNFADDSDISAFTRHASTQIPDSVAATLSGLVGGGALASGMGAVALFAAIPILINRTLDDEYEFERNLGQVLGHELFPHHQERLERETDLPPRTFETLGEFADPVTAHRLNKVVEKQDELLTTVQEADIDVEGNTDSLVDLVDVLATETIPITELISEKFNNAILDPESLIRRQKDRITKELETAAEISEIEAEERVNDLFSKPLREEKLAEDFDGKAPSQGTLLIHGEMGGGTTTFAKGLLEQYAREGYDIGVVNSTTPEILQPKLRSMQSHSERLALVYSVGRERSISSHDFQILFGEEVFDFYDVIIIECSQEQVDSIRSAWKQTRDISHNSAKSRLEPKAEIQLSSINNQKLERIPRTLSSFDSEAVEGIAETADGNPTIAVEATLETLEKGLESISGVRGRELIRDRLNGALQELQDNHGENPVDILVMIAAVRGVEDEKELANLLNISKRKIQIYLDDSLSAYTHKNSDGKLVVSPRIYALTIFELKWFTNLSDKWILSDQGEKFTDQIRDSDEWNTVSLASNLSELQATELNTSSAPSTESIMSCIHDIINQSKLTELSRILATVGIYQAPIRLAVLTNEDRLHKCLHVIFEVSENESLDVVSQHTALLVSGLAGVTVAAYQHDGRSAESFLMYGTNLFREIIHREHGHSELANLMIIRYYSAVLSPLIHSSDLANIKPFIEEVTQRAASVQNSSDVDDVFLVEFYSQILAPHMELGDRPDNYDDWLDFILKEITDANNRSGGLTGLEIPSNELTATESRQFQTSPDRVVVQVFARAIITNSSKDPTDRIQWIENTEARLKRFRTRLTKQSDSPTKSVEKEETIMSLPLWSAILGQIADFHPPEWADKWINLAEQQLSEDFDRARNLAGSEKTYKNQIDTQIYYGWAWFVGDVIFEKRQLNKPGRWTERLVKLLKKQARESPISPLVELRGYALILCRAVQSLIATDDKDLIETWVQWYFDHASEPANSDIVELKQGVTLAEPFAVAPECFRVDVQGNFIRYIIEQLETETEDTQYAVIGGCAHILTINNVPDSELFEWVYEIICTFAVQRKTVNFDLCIEKLYTEIIIFTLDYQNERLTRKIIESTIPRLSEREGSETIFDIIILTMRRLTQVPFDEFHNNAEIVISTAADHLTETEQKEIRDDLPSLLKSDSDSEYLDAWIEGLMTWTKH